MLKHRREGYSFLLIFFFFHKIDTFPTFCFWLFKNQFGSSAFDSLSILNSSVVYSPNSFYIWQRDSVIFIFSSTLGLLLLWWAVDMCLFKPKTPAHAVWTSFFLHDAYYSIPDCFKKLTEQHRGQKITDVCLLCHSPDSCGDGNMVGISFSTSHFPLTQWICSHYLICCLKCACVCV